MNEQFKGQVVLITGAASGFGKLLAEQLSLAGARLLLADRNRDGLHSVVDALSQNNPDVVASVCDVTQEEQVKKAVGQAIETFSRLDIAVNNAGTSTPMKPLVETEEHELDWNFAVNAKGVFFGMKYQIPQMIQQGGGAILNVSSMAGIGGAPKLAAYSAAKHAVIGLTKTAAVEYAKKNVRVNAVCPFYCPTPLIAEAPQELLEQLAHASPMKRLGKPEEIVTAMLNIIAPGNGYMTGQAIALDGGISAY